jgi:hypothetical protein
MRVSDEPFCDATEETDPAFMEIHVAGGQCRFVPLAPPPLQADREPKKLEE